jgi:ribosomal protein S18 acetylase RimI-like enzyme
MPCAPNTDIRAATPADADTIRDLVRAAYAKWVPVIGREPMPMQVDYRLAVQQHRIDLLYVDGAMVGLIETLLRPDHLWIENVAIAPGHQGRGLGRRLLAHAEGLAEASGRGELRLLTNAAFAANVALYEKAGYRVDRREPFKGGTTLYLSKRLDGAPVKS